MKFSLITAALLLSVNAFAMDVVYHVSASDEQATTALRNLKNHLGSDEGKTDRVVVVAHGDGINLMLNDTKDSKGNPFSATVEEFALRGVEFHACANTLRSKGIDKSRVNTLATIVPAGVVDVTRLQAKGYAYIRP